MIKIQTMYPRKDDATSFYRGVGVMNLLDRIDPNVQIQESNSISWQHLMGVDAVFFQRPYEERHVNASKMCLSNNTPLILDYDDLMSGIPVDNHFHMVNNAKGYKTHVRKVMNMAHGIIFSTELIPLELKKAGYLKHDRFTVIPNSVNDYVFDVKESFNNYNKMIVWRGSASHVVDFKQYVANLEKLIIENEDFSFVFIGYFPDMKLKKYKNVEAVESLDIMEYHKFMSDLKPSLFYYPLKDVPFNRGKSNCAKLEATLAGAVTCSMDFPEWRWNDNDEFYFGSPREFYKRMDALINMVRDKDPKIEEEYLFNYQYIKDEFLLSQNNKDRLDYIKKVIGDYNDKR